MRGRHDRPPLLLTLRTVAVTLPEHIIRAMETAAEENATTLDSGSIKS